MLWILAALQLWIADESEKVRPDARPPAVAQAPRIRLVAAGGECVGAQIVVRGPILGLTASARGKVALDLYRVGTAFLEHPSGPDGAIGEWPDPLIPVRDAVYGEERRAFPVDVAGGRAQAIFVEACAPRGGSAGRTSGTVKLSWRGGSLDVPVDLRVRGFDLPATPALVTAFGFSGYSAARGHGRGVDANRELTRAYDLIALRRGIRRSYRRQWQDHFRQRGWLDRLFRYVEDEPSPDAFPRVEAKAREMREDAPDVRRLVTTAWTPALPDVDLWTPVINCLGEKNPTCDRAQPRAKYDRLWWYQSCMSHGCSSDGTPVLHPAFRGWPSYMIDAPATAARVMGTLAFANEVAGELYFDTVYAYHETDPWQSQWAFGGNGDGTLFYPGTPERIGGKRDVPVESLRLVQISRSIADHAYLSLCARLGDPSLARAEARALAPSVRGYSRDPRAYAQMRERLAARIEALLSARKLGRAEAE